MENIGVTIGKFFAGMVIAILVSVAISASVSALWAIGSQRLKCDTGAAGATGATMSQGPVGETGPP